MGAVFILFDKEVAIKVESCLMHEHSFEWHTPHVRFIEHDKLNMFDEGKGVLLFIHSKSKIMSYLPAGNRANSMTFFAEHHNDATHVLAFSKFRDAERSRIDQLLFIFKHEALKHERK